MDITAFRHRGKFAALAAMVLLVATPSFARTGTGHANFFLGQKALDEDDWGPLDRQGEIGAEISFGRDSWPVLIAVDLLGSGKKDSSADVEGSTSELDVGVRKIWQAGSVRPYIGGGVALVNGEIKIDAFGATFSDDDNGVGAWVGGGVFWRLKSRFNIGIAARYSKARVNVFGNDIEAGGPHLGMLLGWGWPASR
jgi:hypothetical protein